VCLNQHTKISNSILSTKSWQVFKYVFIFTQSFYRTLVGLSVYLSTHKATRLYPLYRTLVGLSVYLPTHRAIRLYLLYRTLVGLSVYLYTHKAIRLYPLYRILVGLSVYLPTHTPIRVYTLYRTLVGLSVYLYTHKAIRLYPLYRILVGLSVYLPTHTPIRVYLYSLPNTSRSKCVFIHTHSYQTLSSLPNTQCYLSSEHWLVQVCIYKHTKLSDSILSTE